MTSSIASLDAYKNSARKMTGPHGDIAWWMRGSGRPLLLIHGFPTCSYDWFRIWPDLCDAGFNPIALDMLGFGLSDKPPYQRYDLMQQADLQVQLLGELEIEACDIISHDYGVSIAQELLARQKRGRLPFRIESVAFLNGGLFPEQHRAKLIQRLLNSPLGSVISGLLTRERFGASFASVFGPETQPDAQELDDFWALLEHRGGHRIGHRLIRYIEDRKRHKSRWVGALSENGARQLLINGALDPVSGKHLADHYEAVIPNARIVRLDTIGHYPQWEAPDPVAQAVLEFLG